MKFTPRPYQQACARFIREHDQAALLVDMGLGKTAVMLELIDELVNRTMKARAVLVVAPIRVVTCVWPDEIAHWDDFKRLTYTTIRGAVAGKRVVRKKGLDLVETVNKPNAKALAALETPADIYLVNYENLAALCAWCLKRKVLPFDALILDESSKLKNPSSKAFRALKAILPRFTYRYTLTGTPRPNSMLDLWSQMYCVDLGKRLEPTFTTFRDKYFIYNPWDYSCTLKDKAEQKILAAIRPKVFCLQSKDVLQLPPFLENRVSVELPPAVRTAYDAFEDKLLTMLEGSEISAPNVGAMIGRCRQLTSGAVYASKSMAGKPWLLEYETFHDEKLNALEDILEEAGDNVIVMYEFRHELERCLKRWPKTAWIGGDAKHPEKTIASWMRGQIPLMICHPMSMSHGLNLQAGGHTIVWLTLPWGQDAYAQTVKRLHRSGQSHAVISHHIVAKRTIDETVWGSIMAKDFSQSYLMRSLKEKL